MSAELNTTKMKYMTQTRNTINWIAMFKLNPPKVGVSYKIETEYSSLCASRLNQIGWSAKREHHGDGWTTVRVVEKTRPILMKDALMARLRTLGTAKLKAIIAACEQNGYFDDEQHS